MQKTIILLNFILFLFSDAFAQTDGFWITNYYYRISAEDSLKLDCSHDRIIKIEGKTMINIEFEKVITDFGQPKIDSVVIRRDTLKFISDSDDPHWINERPKRYGNVSFSIVDDKIISVDRYFNTKLVYKKIPNFHRESDILEFELFLQNYLFNYNNGEDEQGVDIIFFMNEYIFKDLSRYGSHIPYWRVEEFGNQIFFVQASPVEKQVSIYQVKEFNETGVTFITYEGDEIIDFNLKIMDKIEKYDKMLLLGKWGRKYDVDVQSPVKSNLDSSDYIYQEILIFNDSIFTIEFDSLTINSKWEIYFNNEVLLFPQLDERIEKHQWRINSLTKDKLVIERRKRKVDPKNDNYQETVEFHKVE